MASAVVYSGGAFFFDMLVLLLILTIANTGILTFQLLRGQQWRLKALPKEGPEAAERPFTVVLATENGASARDAFLAQVLKDGETVEFCEGSVRRGIR